MIRLDGNICGYYLPCCRDGVANIADQVRICGVYRAKPKMSPHCVSWKTLHLDFQEITYIPCIKFFSFYFFR